MINKTKAGMTGTVSGIEYTNITLVNIRKYGIVVDQAYDAKDQKATNGVPITNFTLRDIKGNVTPSGTEIFVNCGNGSCSSWNWSHVSVTGGKKSSKCLSVPQGISC